MKVKEDLDKSKIIITLSKLEAERFLTDSEEKIDSFDYKVTGEIIKDLKFAYNVLNEYNKRSKANE